MKLRKIALAAEALVTLTYARFLVRCVPFSKFDKRLGDKKPGEVMPPPEVSAAQETVVREVRRAINRVNKVMGRPHNCLMLAIAGKTMLNRRGVPNTLIFGAGTDASKGDKSFLAHAWLRVGVFIPFGSEEAAGYKGIMSCIHPVATPPGR